MSKIQSDFLKVAIAQVASVFLDREASLELTCELIVEAGSKGATLIVFPEAFLPAYPEWIWSFQPDQEELFKQFYGHLLSNAVAVPSLTTDRLCRAAQRSRINLVIGVTEGDSKSGSAVCYNTQLFIDSQGQIVGKHRQLILSGAEGLIWTAGDGSTFGAYKFPFGRVGGGISVENYMPLVRYALYAWGIQLYIATCSQPTENWALSLRHIAREGGVYVIGCGRALKRSDLPASVEFQLPNPTGEWLYAGGSMIVNPAGEIICGPFWEQQGVQYSSLGLGETVVARSRLDVTGRQARPDIFELRIDRTDRQPVNTWQGSKLGW